MEQHIAQISLLVADYDEAIAFYTDKLGFEVVQDIPLTEVKRWVVITPKNSKGCKLLLAKASNSRQLACVGNQTGGRVFLFLYTDDFWRDYNHMQTKGVEFTEKPREENYGQVVVFKDLYGNLWDLIQVR
ncbi:MAG: VOC family protein [Maribacter sp.]|nr:VOC family protein [Maribacter sp.]